MLLVLSNQRKAQKRGDSMYGRYILLFVLVFAVFFTCVVYAPPPEPHNVRGTIYHNDSSYATGGIPVTINNTISGDFVRTRTNGVGPSFIDASYSATILGSDGDTIIVIAWNKTNYGINTTVLAATTTYADVILNTTRPSETNVSIIEPADNTMVNIDDYFNVTAKVLVIGGENGVGCSATISFSNSDVLKLAGGESATHDLGNIALGSYKITVWNVSTNLSGASNITIEASCNSDGKNFDNLSRKMVRNLTVWDSNAPVVKLESPANNSKIKVSTTPVIFRYNVTDSSDIANCSLIINNKINKTNYSVIKGTSQNFSVILDNGTYNWSINCTDNSTSHNVGASVTFNLSITPNFIPKVTNMVIDGPIELVAGSFSIVYCNATVSDDNNISDLKNISSFLYHTSVSVMADDDRNNHYTNHSCKEVSSTKYSADYSCSFVVYYYANNGSWVCNITAEDKSNYFGSNETGTTVNSLLAIDVSPDIIDYGELSPGDISSGDVTVNITNVGNIDFNVTVEGFAVSEGDGLAMDCDKGVIDVGYERYSVYEGKAYNQMINLSSSSSLIYNLTLPQRTNDTTYKKDRNYTYWKMGVPYGVSGNCSGFVKFVAIEI